MTMSWLHADAHPHNGGYLIGTRPVFPARFVAAIIANLLKKFNPFDLLDRYRRLDHGGHGHGRYVRSIVRDRLHRRLVDLVGFRPVRWRLGTWPLGTINVQTVATPEGSGECFLGHHHVCRRTLGPRLAIGRPTPAASAMPAAPSCSAPDWPCWQCFISGRVFRGSRCRGASSSPRPLIGTTVGDFLDKPVHDGGLAFSRPIASAIIAVVIVALVVILPQRAGQHPGQATAEA